MNNTNQNKSPTGLSIASLVTGILSAMPVFGFGLSIAAIVCGALDLKKHRGIKEMNTSKGFDIAGIVLGSLSIVAGIVLIIVVAVAAVFYNLQEQIFIPQNWDLWSTAIKSIV